MASAPVIRLDVNHSATDVPCFTALISY